MYKKISSSLFIFIIAFSGCSSPQNKKTQPKQSTPTIELNNLNHNEPVSPIVIIGGGIAGLTAALYSSQASLETVVIEGNKQGGALAQSHSVRNWPGVNDKPGALIVEDIKKQIENQGVSIIPDEVININLNSWPYSITTKNSQTGNVYLHKALSVIIAMGTEPNYLNIPGEQGDSGYWGKGVSNCAVCDGSLYKGKKVAIVGGGDAAFTEASYLADIAKHVTIIVRKDHFKAKDERTKLRVLNLPNVTVIFNTSVTQIHGDGTKVTKLTLVNNANQSISNMEVDGLFLAIGSRPNTYLFKNLLAQDEQGFLLLKNHQETSMPGIFAAGDVCDKEFVQAITAAGQGCMAALQANSFLEHIGFNNKEFMEQQKQIPKNMQAIELKHAGQVKEISTKEEFNKLIRQSPLPVILDLYSTYCQPCKALLPIIEQIAHEQTGKIACYKLNVNSSLLSEVTSLGTGAIDSVPLILFIENNKIKGSSLGKKTKEELLTLTKRLFNV